MSNQHNKLKTVKLSRKNTKSVDRVAALKTKILRVSVSRTSVANHAIEIGIKHIKT